MTGYVSSYISVYVVESNCSNGYPSIIFENVYYDEITLVRPVINIYKTVLGDAQEDENDVTIVDDDIADITYLDNEENMKY